MQRCIVTWTIKRDPAYVPQAGPLCALGPATGKTALREVLASMGDVVSVEGDLVLRERIEGSAPVRWVERGRYRVRSGDDATLYVVDTDGVQVDAKDCDYDSAPRRVFEAFRARKRMVCASDVRRFLTVWALRHGAPVRAGVYLSADADEAETLARDVSATGAGEVFVIKLSDGAQAVRATLDELRTGISQASSASATRQAVSACKRFEALFADELSAMLAKGEIKELGYLTRGAA